MHTTDHWMHLNERPPVPMTRGEGSYLWDESGKRYLDFIQGWAVNALGHCPRPLRVAMTQQLETVINVGPAHFNAPALQLSARLSRASGLDRVCLLNSGCEANEAAVKLARKWGQKYRGGAYEVITTLDSFHGRTLAMTTATGKPGFDTAFAPTIAGFPKAAYGDVDALRTRIGEHTVAVMLEPIQGEAGVVVPPPGYLKAVRELCDERGILLILDEIQTGCARTGPLFAHQAEAITPDILTVGKALGGGMPIAAMCAKEGVACFDKGDHGSTFGGNPVCASAALAVLDVLESDEQRLERELGANWLEAQLNELALELGAGLRGKGHLWALVFPKDVAEGMRQRAYAAGLLINAPRPHLLRLMPALNVSRGEIEEMASILRAAA